MKKKNIRKLLYACILSLAIVSLMPNETYAFVTSKWDDGGHWAINTHNNTSDHTITELDKKDKKGKGKWEKIETERAIHINVPIYVNRYTGTGYKNEVLDKDGNRKKDKYYYETNANVVDATYNMGLSFDFKARSTDTDDGYNEIPKKALMLNQQIAYSGLSFNGAVNDTIVYSGGASDNKSLFFHNCKDHTKGCSAGVGGEFNIELGSNNLKYHWLDASTYGLATEKEGKQENSYIQNYTKLNTVSESGSEDNSIADGTKILHFNVSIKAHDVFGTADASTKTDTVQKDHIEVITGTHASLDIDPPTCNPLSIHYTSSIVPNTTYNTFLIPNAYWVQNDTSNTNIFMPENGRFVIRRDLVRIIGYSEKIGEQLNHSSTTDTTNHAYQCTLLTTYGSSKNNIKVGGQEVSDSAGKDITVGSPLVLIGYNGQGLKVPKYGYNNNGNVNNTYAITRKIVPSIMVNEYTNVLIKEAKNTNDRKYYSKNYTKKASKKDSKFDIDHNSWNKYSIIGGKSNKDEKVNSSYNTTAHKVSSGESKNFSSRNTTYVSGITTNKNNKQVGCYFSDQGDITYHGGRETGGYAIANEFYVDSVYGRIRGKSLKKVKDGEKYLWQGITQGFNSIENTAMYIANPKVSGTTKVNTSDNMKGYHIKKERDSSGKEREVISITNNINNNFSVAKAAGGNNVYNVSVTGNLPIYNQTNIGTYIQNNTTSRSDKQLYQENGAIASPVIDKTWEQNKYTVHFITNYGYVMSSTGSNSNKTLTNLDGSDRHSFKGEAKSSDVTFTNASSANQPNGAGVSIGCDNGVNGTAKSVNIGGVTYTYYDKVYAFGSELYTNSMPNVYLRKPGTNAVNNTYKTARANNPSDNTGCVWYIATVGSDGKLQCTFADDDNLFQYLTGFKQENRANSQVAIDLDDGAEIYVVAYWAPTKNKFYLVGDDGIVYVPDSADASTPITNTDPKAYKAYRNATNNKGDLHSDLNGDGRANELINYVDKFGSGNSGNKFSLGKGLECSYDDTKKLYYVEIYNDATFDKYGKFAGMEEGAVYENGTIMFPTGDTCYGYTFDRPNRRKYDENNNPASWLQWTRFVVPSGNGTDDKLLRDEKNYVSWIENTNTLTGNVTHINLPASYAENANSGICLKITGTQLYTFNGAINDGYDYGTNEDTDNEVFLYATWFPNTYQIEYDGNNNWNYNEILRGGSDAGNKHVESNIYYNKTINLFDGFKRDSSATDNTYNIAGQKLHDNKGDKDDLDEWKLLGYWSTSHGNVNSRINSGAEKQVGNVTFDISLNGNSRSEFNLTPGNPVRGLVDSGSISLKAIWRRAVAVSYEMNGGKTVENKFLLNNAGDKSSGNDTKLYVAGYMWNDDVSIKLKVPYGEVTKNGVNDSIKKDGYRFIGWALDEAGADGTGSYKTYTDGDTVIKSVNSRLNCNENPDMIDSDSTPDLNEALNTIERYHESFTPDGNVYVDIDSVVGDKPNLVTSWDITGEQERWNAGDRSKGCNGRLEISRSVFDVGDGANNPFSTKVGNSEATGNNPYVDYGCGLPSKNLDVYSSKNMRGDLNNDNGYSKDEEIDVTNSVVAHAMWEGILQARVTYSIQNDERKTLQYSAMNKDNYESSYIKREYNGNGTVLCGSLLANSGKLGNDITKAADAIDSVQGGNLFETSVSETTAITDLPDLVMVRQYSSKDVYIDSDGKLVKRGSGSENTTLDRQYSFDNESKTWSSPISRLTLAEAVKGTYESQNDLLNKPENSEASEDSGLAVVGKIGSGDENKTTLISALNGFNANNQNKYYGFYRQNMFSGSPKLSVDNYDQLYVKYKEYIPLYLHYTMNPNANDRKFLTKCARGEGGSYVIQTELRKFSFYYSVHSSNNTGNEYKAETIRIPVRLNIYASETNTSGPVPPVPDPPSGGGKGGNDPSHPTSQGGGVKSTLDLPEQTQ